MYRFLVYYQQGIFVFLQDVPNIQEKMPGTDKPLRRIMAGFEFPDTVTEFPTFTAAEMVDAFLWATRNGGRKRMEVFR